MKTRRKSPPSEKPALDMSSLIDVSFLLLVFFLVTSTLDPKEGDLGLTMPSGEGPAEVGIDDLHVEINDVGHIVVDELEVLDTDSGDREVPLLVDRLRTYAESARLIGEEPFVVLSVSDSAKSQRFVDVLNALDDPSVGISRIALADAAKK